MSHLETRVSLVERDLAHGSSLFEGINLTLTKISITLDDHMKLTERRTFKVLIGTISFLLISLVGVIGSWWMVQIGGG